MSKPQIPNKSQFPKSQIDNYDCRPRVGGDPVKYSLYWIIEILEFGWTLVIGFWDLFINYRLKPGYIIP